VCGVIRHIGEKPLTADHLIARIAARQHGVITIEQLLAVGLTHHAVRSRVRAGRLYRVHRGVYAVGHRRLTDHGRWKAATLALGPRAVLSHRSAAELWELLSPNGAAPHVSLPYPASPAKRANINIHRSRTLAATRTSGRFNIPVTMPARTLADLARLAAPAEVRRATRAAEKLGLPLDPGCASEKTESDLERDFLAICRSFDVPEPETQVQIGRYRVDFLWRRRRLVIEVDGYIYHRGRQAMRYDNDRDLELELRGLRVVRIEDSRIASDPAGVAAAVLGLLRAAP
jgi:very-short-patch-repair endonuclease